MKVLVTGGSRGIGKQICNIFADNGHEVFAPTRRELELSDRESVHNFIEKHRHCGIDSLINNAGINPLGNIEEISPKDVDECFQVNLISPMLLAQGFIGHMKSQRRGYIVNIGSIWGVVSKEKRATYSMSKNGIHGLTTTLAVELGTYGILVNTVCPGFTKTELTAKNISVQEENELCRAIPLGRFAKPCEIAQLVYFLGSESNTYISGQRIIIDGGFTAR